MTCLIYSISNLMCLEEHVLCGCLTMRLEVAVVLIVSVHPGLLAIDRTTRGDETYPPRRLFDMDVTYRNQCPMRCTRIHQLGDVD